MSVNGDLVQKPEWRLVFIESQRGIHTFLTRRKINIVVMMMDTVCWYERRIFRLRCESCVISRWQSEPPASSSVCVPRAYSLTLSTFATMATSSMRSCRLLCCPEGRSCAGWQHVCLLCSALHTGLNVQKPSTDLFFSTCDIYFHAVLPDFILNY